MNEHEAHRIPRGSMKVISREEWKRKKAMGYAKYIDGKPFAMFYEPGHGTVLQQVEIDKNPNT
jgi:hypothetical protein